MSRLEAVPHMLAGHVCDNGLLPFPCYPLDSNAPAEHPSSPLPGQWSGMKPQRSLAEL